MMELSLESLIRMFNRARELNQKFVAIRVEMDGYPTHEIIINPIENADAKLDYYKTAYDNELNHKYSNGIRITDFAFGMDMNEIQEMLNY